MGTAMGRTTDPVDLFAELAAEPYRQDFYQTLRRLECAFPDKPRWGKSRLPGEDPVRLGQAASLAFAPSPIASFTPPTATEPARLQVYLFGLLGPNGPLPIHLTEYARDRERHAGDRTFVRFLDLLQHRFLALFYRAWSQAQPHVNRDRPEDDRFAGYVGAFVGVTQHTLRDRDATPDLAKLFHAGTLVRQARNAGGLEAILQDFLRIPVRVQEFVGHWMALGPREQTSLAGTGAELGLGAVLGRAVWDRQHKFRVELGPLSLAQYETFLPGGGRLAQLVAWVRLYACFELDWDVRLVLKQDQVPRLALGRSGRLGWTTWLGNRAGSDADDLCLDAEAFESRARGRVA